MHPAVSIHAIYDSNRPDATAYFESLTQICLLSTVLTAFYARVIKTVSYRLNYQVQRNHIVVTTSLQVFQREISTSYTHSPCQQVYNFCVWRTVIGLHLFVAIATQV